MREQKGGVCSAHRKPVSEEPRQRMLWSTPLSQARPGDRGRSAVIYDSDSESM